MKKLIFLLLFIGFFSSADDICELYVYNEQGAIFDIMNKCKRGDILSAETLILKKAAQRQVLLELIAPFCRFDKEIIFQEVADQHKLICVIGKRRY